MSSAHAFGHQFGAASIPNVAPIVFVVDDDDTVRVSLGQLIHSQGWRPEVFESAGEFLAQSRPLVPSCLIIALSPADPNDLNVQKHIARERPEVPIIVISGYGDIPTTVQVIKAGAVDLLVKPFSNEILLGAIRQGLERSRVALDREGEIHDLRNRHASLTSRERQVMALVVSGLLNKQVAAELRITESTVKAHRGQVMRKMKADSLAGLVSMASQLQSSPQQSTWRAEGIISFAPKWNRIPSASLQPA
jgi:FixJ family two-component response regulator